MPKETKVLTEEDKIQQEAPIESLAIIEPEIIQNPPEPLTTVQFRYDRDTLIEAQVLKENEDGTVDLTCQIEPQAFRSRLYTGPTTVEYKSVREGVEIGTFRRMPS